jgi:hypothetical protein
MDGTELNSPAPRTNPAGTAPDDHDSDDSSIVNESNLAKDTRNVDTTNPYKVIPHSPKRWRSPAALGWLISLLLHSALAGTFLLVSIYREPLKLQNQPNLQTPVQTAFSDLELAPLVTKLQVEPMLKDDFALEHPALPGLPERTTGKPAAPSAAGNLAVWGDDGSGFSVPANTLGAGDPYRSRFCGTVGTAQGICYVVDCSGSMVMALEYVRSELLRAIGQLTPAQYFQVIFYAGGEPIELVPGGLIRASAPNRQRALKFVDQIKLKTVADATAAAPAVVKALEKALTATTSQHMQASLVYLLTDGQYDHAYVEEALRKIQAQRARPARINVISCGIQQNENFLRRLALDYKGSYHFVSDEQMTEKK